MTIPRNAYISVAVAVVIAVVMGAVILGISEKAAAVRDLQQSEPDLIEGEFVPWITEDQPGTHVTTVFVEATAHSNGTISCTHCPAGTVLEWKDELNP